MSALVSWLSLVWLWAQAHPLLALGLAASVLGTVGNSLSHFPRAQTALLQVAAGIGWLLKTATDVMAVVAHADGRGLVGALTLPGVPTLAPKPSASNLAGPLVVLLALGGTVSGCAFLRGLSADAGACVSQVTSDAKPEDVEPTVDAALHLDEQGALSSLGALAVKYGDDFVTCLVAKQRARYAAQAPDAGTAAPSARAASSTAQRVISNADAWLAGRRAGQ